jgi:hypothetical protein
MTSRRQTLLALLALAAVLLAMAGGWWHYVNQIPDYPTPVATLPSPNAYDDYVAAAALLSADVPVPGRLDRTPQSERQRILTRNLPALDRLRQGFPHSYQNPPLYAATQTLPELTEFRRLAGLLVLEGKLAEAEGRPADAAASYLDCLRLGSDSPQGGTLAHAMTGVAIHELSLRQLDAVIERLDAQTAELALKRMRKLDTQALPFSQVLTSQRDMSLAHFPALLRAATAEQLGRKIGFGADWQMSATYLVTPKRTMMEDLRRYMNAAIKRTAGSFVSAAASPPVPSDPLNQWLTPDYDSAWCWYLERDAAWRVTETRLALRVYRAGHSGQPPPVLSQLTPALLPSIPEDPFVGQPLIYRPQAGEPHVYSRGPDGDDDGGRPLDWPRRGGNGDVATMRRIR